MINMDMFRKQLAKEIFIGNLNVSRELAMPVPEAVRAKLPKEGKILAFVLALDMDDKQYEAILFRWFDENQKGWRVAHFRLSTGEYVDDYIL